ncbi:MAG TPA: hypothetical protein VJB65_02855, partial [Patescibacteria group bacterium]|nr:hypothetical protein [Patescibacteria group bacterium]
KIKLTAVFKNTGEITVPSILVTEIYQEDTLLDTQRSNEIIIDKTEEREIIHTMQFSRSGEYTLVAYVEYGHKVTQKKSITVSVENAFSFFHSFLGIAISITIIFCCFAIGVFIIRRLKQLNRLSIEGQLNNTKSVVMHWVFGAMLVLITVIVMILLIIANSQADDVTTSATISNTAPAVDSVYISDSAGGGVDSYGSGITLSSGTTRTVHVNGVVSDVNGNGDIADTGVTVVLYRSGATGGASCSQDNNDCYSVSGVSCTLANASSTTRTYTCPVALQFYADATDSGTYAAQNWLAKVTVVDASAASGNTTHGGVEVNSLTALSIPSTIGFGSLELNQSTTDSNNVEQTVAQAGNTTADVNVSSAAAMSCTSGTIPIANQTWAVTDVVHASGTTLSDTPADTNLGVQIRTADGANTSKVLYWGIQIPASGVGGSCSGTTVISTIAG